MEQVASRQQHAPRQGRGASTVSSRRRAEAFGARIDAAPVARTGALFRNDAGRLLRMKALWWMAALMAALPASFQVMMGSMAEFDPWGSVVGLTSSVVFVGTGIALALLVAEDWRSGFVKNVFAVSPNRGGYVLAKILAGGVANLIMVAGYVLGAALAGLLLHSTYATGFGDLLMAVLSKAAMGLFFSGLFVCVDIPCKHRAWLAVMTTCIIAMLFAPAMLGTAMMPPIAAAGMSLAAAAIGVVAFRALALLIMNGRDLV